jgi:3-oxo-5-alpha-steroid 4-dehydrogenase 3
MIILPAYVMQKLTELLSPAYLLLSLVALASRYLPSLKEVASHGKTLLNNQQQRRHSANNSSRWLVSKRWYVHFYLMGLCSVGLVQYAAGRLSLSDEESSASMQYFASPIFAARTLLVLHLCRRIYECLFVQQYSEQSSKMHILGYALGMGHYLVLPLVFWNISADSRENRHRLLYRANRIPMGNNVSRLLPLLILILSNLWMQNEQYRHHLILARLRLDRAKKDDGDNNNTSSHLLPSKQRWFQWVLCPHYLAEILLYVSFVLLLEWHQQQYIHGLIDLCRQEFDYTLDMTLERKWWQWWIEASFDMRLIQNVKDWNYRELLADALNPLQRLRHLMLLLWVVTNLTISAMNNYQWYETFFPDKVKTSTEYPFHTTIDGRKALIPCWL